jgi:hypothetical protein
MIAETSVGLGLTALVWARPLRPLVSNVLVFAAIWLAVVCPVSAELFGGVGIQLTPDHAKHLMEASAVLAGLAAILSRRVLLMLVGALGAVALCAAPQYAKESDWQLAGAGLVFVGALLGIHRRLERPRGSQEAGPPLLPARPALHDDIAIFVAAMVLATVVAIYVLGRHTDSGDEWADTYQAALFIKGKAFEPVPVCAEAFRSFWVFQYEGRSFAQYTPGWPLFMAPFVPLGVVWLAGPAALGLLAVAVAKLSRRAVSGFSRGTMPPTSRELRAAGWFGAAATTLGSTMLINGGSRYPHVFVAAMYAWSVEELFVMCDRSLARKRQAVAGLLLGTTAALSVAARPADGLTLGIGLFLYFVYALARKRVPLVGFLVTVAAAAFWGVLCLVILRLQVGVWFKTGYSLAEIYYSWMKVGFSFPKPDEYRSSMPLDTGAYCWWPASPALGLAGIFALRGRAQRILFVFTASFLPFVAFYTAFEFGRHWDAGYGPRYQLPCVVPMAVGTAVVATELWRLARVRHGRLALSRGGPFAILVAAVVVGIVRIAPLVYPFNWADVADHNALQDALEKARFRHTVVIAKDGVSNIDSLDLPENLPLSLYPHQEVLIARSPSHESDECVTKNFSDWNLVVAERRGSSVWFHPFK